MSPRFDNARKSFIPIHMLAAAREDVGDVLFVAEALPIDVEKTVAFYERAFGLKRKMVKPDEFGELDTGSTRLSFAARAHVASLFPIPFQRSGPEHDAPPLEIGLVTHDVQAAFAKAIAVGAVVVTSPTQKPWGQVVGYVRDNNGFLVELCTPIE